MNPRGTILVFTGMFISIWMTYLIITQDASQHIEDFKFSLQQYLPDDVSCYHDDDIEDVYWRRFTNRFTSTDVYFHWTSCGSTMKLAHLCAVEAATRAYPHEKVYVLFLKPLEFSLKQESLLNKFLEYMKSVKFVRISILSYLNETGFQYKIAEFLNSGLTKKHKRVEEMLKLSTLYRNGGIVVDTDVIVTKIPDIGAHWLVRERDMNISSTMFSFKIDAANFIRGSIALLEHRIQYYNLSACLTNRYNICLRTTDCEDITILDKNIVDVKYTDKVGMVPPAFAYRVIDKLFERRFPNNSLLGVIAQKYCPFVYSHSYLFK